jgi:hypothetical protein
MGNEVAGCQVAHQRLVDRRAFEHQLVDVPGERQLGEGNPVLNRTGLLPAEPSARRIYCDFASTRSKAWIDILLWYAIVTRINSLTQAARTRPI